MQNGHTTRQDTEAKGKTIMNDLFILILAFGIPVAILLVLYEVHEFRERLRWKQMWKDLADIAEMDKGRVRWHQFLRNDDSEHQIALPETEQIFQGIWKDTRMKGEIAEMPVCDETTNMMRIVIR